MGSTGEMPNYRRFLRVPRGDAWQLGMLIFQRYNLSLQVVGTLVLVASVGVVILSKRELK